MCGRFTQSWALSSNGTENLHKAGFATLSRGHRRVRNGGRSGLDIGKADAEQRCLDGLALGR